MQVLQTVPWAIEQHGPKTVACFVPDDKGALCAVCVEKGAARHKFFKYIGINIPAETIKEIGKKYPGVLVESIAEPKFVNADLGVCFEDQVGFLWHNNLLIYFGEQQISGA